MKRILAILLVLGMILTAACSALAEEMEVTILSENYLEYEGYSGRKAVYLAKIQNNTGAGYYVTSGTISLLDADGNEAASNKYFTINGSRYLAPGEISIVSIETKIPEGVEIKDHKVEIIPIEKYYSGEDYVIEVDETVYDPTNESNPQIAVAITNTYDKPLAHVTMIYAVEDADGNIYYLGQYSLGQNELGANSSFIFHMAMTKELVSYVQENGITLTQVESYAFAEER